MYSLRRTLSVRFSLTMFVALMLFGMGAFVGVRRTLRRLTDQGLTSALELESDVLALGRSVAQSPYQDDITAFVEGINRFVVVRDASGQIVVRNTPLASGLPLNSAAFQEALDGTRVFSTERWASGQIRSLYSRTPPGSHPGFAVLQVSASLSPLARTDRGVFLFIFLIVIVATAGTALGAGWLAKSAVAPVGLITDRARDIHAGTLKKQRISAHADTLEFHGLVGVLNSMLDRLDRALTAQQRIIADVGHELRTPITAMQGIENKVKAPDGSDGVGEFPFVDHRNRLITQGMEGLQHPLAGLHRNLTLRIGPSQNDRDGQAVGQFRHIR